MLVLLFSCANGTEDRMEELLKESEEQKVKPELEVPREMLYEIIQQIPSPLEISNLIKQSGAVYSEEILNPVEHSKNYVNKYAQAINLGIYGTDLGYINIYSKYQASIVYLAAVREMSEELRIGQFFDFTTIARLAANSSEIDSILYISTQGFDNMNVYLKEQGRDEISILLLVGGWLEAVYILTEVASKYPSDELYERVGDQKIMLDDLILIMSLYKGDPYFEKISKSFEVLKEAFSSVEISYVQGERTISEVDGVLVIEDNNKSIVKISEVQVDNIKKVVHELRNELVR
tara:strand:+ start:355 stop:1227 length:873 start_codon:yes stop_codon:yes gene_type:complete